MISVQVQENCIDLVGRIADRGPEYVSAREWMRICFELLELLKAHKKAIRRATVNTFGYIAKAIGQVIPILLVSQSREPICNRNFRLLQSPRRIGDSAEQFKSARTSESCLHDGGHRNCGRNLFTFYGAAGADERIPSAGVERAKRRSEIVVVSVRIHRRNGKGLYLRSDAVVAGRVDGSVSGSERSVVGLIERSSLICVFLFRRDLVHRQTACSAIKHMSLGVYGFGCEDALIHLLNYMWPNVFETSPHLVQAFLDGVEGLRVALGPVKILQYTLQVINGRLCRTDAIAASKLMFFFVRRDCSIRPERFVTCTGKFITRCI